MPPSLAPGTPPRLGFFSPSRPVSGPGSFAPRWKTGFGPLQFADGVAVLGTPGVVFGAAPSELLALHRYTRIPAVHTSSC